MQVLEYKGNNIRTVMVEGKPWFAAKDVCSIIGIKHNNVTMKLQRLPKETYQLIPMPKARAMNFVSLAGIYGLAAIVDKEEALEFKTWLVSQVLPQEHPRDVVVEVAEDVPEVVEVEVIQSSPIEEPQPLESAEVEKGNHPLEKLFHYQGASVRVVMIEEEPWFVAKDVCDVLGLANPTQAVERLDEDEKTMFNIGRQGETNIVNEPGLYSLVLRSRKPEAKSFKRWITHEVLTNIRKTGMYMTNEAAQEASENPLDFFDKAMKYVKGHMEQLEDTNRRLIEEQRGLLEDNERLKREEAILQARAVNFEIEAKRNQPEVEIGATFSIQETADILGVPAEDLITQLLAKDILCKGEYPVAKMTVVQMGYFTRKLERVWTGWKYISAEVSRVTHNGLIYLSKLINRV